MRRTLVTCDLCDAEIRFGNENVIKYSLTEFHYCKDCFNKLKEFLKW